MSLALKQAVMLADALTAHDDVLEAARAYEAESHEEVVPWYQFSVLTDQMRSAAVAAGRDPSTGQGDPFGSLFTAGGADPEVIRLAASRVMNLLELPITLMSMAPRSCQAKAAANPTSTAGPVRR